MVSEFQKRRDFIVGRLKSLPGMKIAEPQGAFYVLPDVTAYFGEGVHADDFGPVGDASELCRYLIEKAHVALVPGDAFGAPNCIRISYAASIETLGKAMDRLDKYLDPSVFHTPSL
jgi:aspartate/glutamate/aspartate-prephenate aminotransferase